MPWIYVLSAYFVYIGRKCPYLSSLSHLPSISMADGSWKPPGQGGGCAHDANTGAAMTCGSSGRGGTEPSSPEAG
jgi:hypothetical protein